MTYFWSVPIWVGIVLQVLVVAALLRGPYRNFKVLFVYSVVLFLITIGEAAAFYDREIWTKTSRHYWIGDAILQTLIFVLVISLVHRAMAASQKRATIRRILIGGATLFVVLSVYLTHDPVFGAWMTQLSRNLGFAAVILNLVLWAALIREESADRRLLLVSGGLGIQMAGKAIGHSLRHISRGMILTGDVIIVFSHLICLYIWWQAFRSFDRPAPER
jgi:uncharacterized membrane protein